MSLFLQSVRVATGSDEDGVLVFTQDHRLVAVLVRLTEQHEDLEGQWFLEVGFGRLSGPDHRTFVDLDQAQDWITHRLAREAA